MGAPLLRKDWPDVRLSTWFKLAGIALVVIIVVQVTKSIAGHTDSGCGLASGDIAHAGNIDCPSYITQAASDPSWAAQRAGVRCKGKAVSVLDMGPSFCNDTK